jgi:hypothetical protein
MSSSRDKGSFGITWSRPALTRYRSATFLTLVIFRYLSIFNLCGFTAGADFLLVNESGSGEPVANAAEEHARIRNRHFHSNRARIPSFPLEISRSNPETARRTPLQLVPSTAKTGLPVSRPNVRPQENAYTPVDRFRHEVRRACRVPHLRGFGPGGRRQAARDAHFAIIDPPSSFRKRVPSTSAAAPRHPGSCGRGSRRGYPPQLHR